MNSGKAGDRGEAARRVRDFIDKLDREGETEVKSRNAKASGFRKVSIPTIEAESIREWVLREQASRTIEVGLAYGFSALHICHGLLLGGAPEPKHVVMDPWQTQPEAYASSGLDHLEAAGVSGLIEFHSEPSQLVLPQFLKEGRRFDLAFVDGNHRFDAVFLDLYYLGHLVRRGGIIIVDDYDFPGIEHAVSFFLKNLDWKIEESASGGKHCWAVIRTAEKDDDRDFRYFVEF